MLMLVPLMILAALSVVGGLVGIHNGFEHFLEPVFGSEFPKAITGEEMHYNSISRPIGGTGRPVGLRLAAAVLTAIAVCASHVSAQARVSPTSDPSASKARKAFVKPSDSDLKKKLTPLQYEVTQREATETPFRNAYWDNHEPGIYVDVVSGEPLFSSTDKFDSGTGWPSFTRPLEPANIHTKTDRLLGYERTEVRSAQTTAAPIVPKKIVVDDNEPAKKPPKKKAPAKPAASTTPATPPK